MTNCVLICGALDEASLKRAEGELFGSVAAGARELTLVIDSGGGLCAFGLEFIEALRLCEAEGVEISARIYDALSMAALIALAVHGPRVLASDGRLGFHRSRILVNAYDFDSDSGLLCERLRDQTDKYANHLNKVLAQYGFADDTEMMTTLRETNWLTFGAPAALKYGMVREIF